MKTNLPSISILAALITASSAIYAQNNNQQDATIYPIESRLADYTRPIMFTPNKATPVNGAISENIMTTTQNVLNKEAPFLKKGIVKPVGEEQFSAWEMLSDEGGAEHPQTAPNPLTYYIAGSASSLLTQVERSIEILGLEVANVKIESKIFFRWSDVMTSTWSGYTDKVVSNILIESNESPEKIKALKEMAIKAWAVGEGLENKTPVDAATLVNVDNWAGLSARSGKIESPISIDNGRMITNVTPDLNLETMKVEKDLSIDFQHLPNPLIFTEIAVAESADDPQRPYMHKIRGKSLTENYATWEIYSDDSRGYKGVDKAPTSRDYFTMGTSFCLMSQLTANKMYFQHQGVNIADFRVEHQFNYQQDNFMTPAMTGHLDSIITRISVTSDASVEAVNNYTAQSLNTCFAGEGLVNETEMDTKFYLNGKIVK